MSKIGVAVLNRIAGRLMLSILLGFAVMCVLPAQTGRGGDLTLKIAVMGPGDELYFWWGHIALIIEDARTRQSRFYDYGLFSFENKIFFVNFALGRLLYSCGASASVENINTYKNANRDIVLYTLNISPEKRDAVRGFTEKSILPENRNYLYHHFKDNCSTRIRDIIDLAADGRFRERFGSEPGRFTLRQHVRRHTWHSPFIDWLLCFLMGQNIDTPITVWDEMFLPSEVAARITDFEFTDSAGITRKLVSRVETVYEAHDRPAVLDVPRRQWLYELAAGLLLAMLLCGLFFVQKKAAAVGQVVLGIFHSVLGLFFGGAGLVLFFMSFFTSHDYTYHNANLLFCGPPLLIAVPLGIRYAFSINYDRRLKTEAVLRLLWFFSALGILFSMLIKLSPRFWQQNLPDQALMLPAALILSLEPAGLRRMFRRIFWRWL